jgi:hypothetical protein
MSRIGECDDYEGSFPNEWAFWERRTRQVLKGRPGRKALAELREALLALPEKRLISDALSTVGKEKVDAERARWYQADHDDLLEQQGQGVCAVGAFVWYQRVKAGADPQQAMAELPLNPYYDGDPEVTVQAGKAAGLTWDPGLGADEPQRRRLRRPHARGSVRGLPRVARRDARRVGGASVTVEAGIDPTCGPTTEVLVTCPSCGALLPLRVVRVEVDSAGNWPGLKASIDAESDHSCTRRSRART